MTSVIVQPQAQVDIDEALGWYSQRDPTIAGRLMVELDIVFDRIGDNPSQFPVVDDGVRRIVVVRPTNFAEGGPGPRAHDQSGYDVNATVLLGA